MRSAAWTSLAPGCSAGRPCGWRTSSATLGWTRPGGSRHPGPVLSKQLYAGRGALHRLPHLLAFHCRGQVSALVTPMARMVRSLHRSSMVTLPSSRSSPLGPCGAPASFLGQGDCVLCSDAGHIISPAIHMCYGCVICMAWVACCPSVTQAFVHAIRKCRSQPPADSPFRRALRTLHLPGWYPRDG